ncbi:MAG: DHA2 family efflux MFS transporter permease subunit [Gammaproteobacteria bacterium]
MNDAGQALPPLGGAALALVALAVTLATFMEVLDTTIVNAAIPAVAGGLGVSPTEGTWTISAYALAAAVVQPLTGWLALRFGEVRTFQASIALFTLTSVLCGLASSIDSLVLFRLLQGATSGPLLPLSQTLMMACFPPHRKGVAIALWSVTALTAPVMGPIIGGWLSDEYSWRWMFFINVPVGMFSLAVTRILLRGRETPTQRLPVDYSGALLLIIGVGSLQFVLDNGHTRDWLESDLIVWLLIASAVALGLFLIWERDEQHPVVELSLFANRNFTIAAVVMAVGTSANFGTMVIFSLWMQGVLGYTATRAGLSAAAFGVATVVAAMAIGPFLGRLPLRTVVTGALLLSAVGALWPALLPPDATFLQLSAPRLVQGTAVSLCFIPLFQMLVSQVPARRLACANGVASFLRVMGISAGTALAVTTWDQRSDTRHALLAAATDPARAAVTDVAAALPVPALDAIAWAQARTDALYDLYWMSILVYLALIPLVWLARPHEGGEPIVALPH